MNTELKNAEPLTPDEFKDYKFHCDSVRINLQAVSDATEEIGESLKELRDRKLYRQDYGTFAEFVNQEYGKSARWAYQKLEEIRVLTNLEKSQNVKSISQNPTSTQSIHLATLPDEEQADAWAESQEKAESEGRETPTTKDVKETVSKRKNAKGGEYKGNQNDKPDLVGPDAKEFHKHYGPLVRHLSAMDKYYKTDAFYGARLEDLDNVCKKYNEAVVKAEKGEL